MWLSKKFFRRRTVILITTLILFSIGLAIFKARDHPTSTVLAYKGKPVELWFNDPRTNFFLHNYRIAGQEAFQALGTNAFPFLIGILKEKNNNLNILHSRIYRLMPRWLKARLHVPVSNDDRKVRAIEYLHHIYGLSTAQLAELADSIANLPTSRLRVFGLSMVMSNYKLEPEYVKMCEALLTDSDPGVRLEAAIDLEYAIYLNAPDSYSRLHSRFSGALMSAFISNEPRKRLLEAEGYTRSSLLPRGYNPDEILRTRIFEALTRLEPHLNQDQRNLFHQVVSERPIVPLSPY